MAISQKKITVLASEPRPMRKPVKTRAKTKIQGVKSTKSQPLTRTEMIADVAGSTSRHSKQAMLITLMRRAEGATLEDLTAATGWQRHSVRGAISGVMKKRLGFVIASSVEARGRVYRIAGERR